MLTALFWIFVIAAGFVVGSLLIGVADAACREHAWTNQRPATTELDLENPEPGSYAEWHRDFLAERDRKRAEVQAYIDSLPDVDPRTV